MHESISDMRGDMKDMRQSIGKMDRSMATLPVDVSHMANTAPLTLHSARNLGALTSRRCDDFLELVAHGGCDFVEGVVADG